MKLKLIAMLVAYVGLIMTVKMARKFIVHVVAMKLL
jgi:hypothetical protein